MTSRFPESIDFDPLCPEACIKLMANELKGWKVKLKGKKPVDLSCLEKPHPRFIKKLEVKFRTLSSQDSWANARDVKQLAKKVFQKLDLSSAILKVTESLIHAVLDEMTVERGGRMANTKRSLADLAASVQADGPRDPPSTLISSSTKVQEQKSNDESEEEADFGPAGEETIRDPGVSDAVWEQLQRDKEKEVQQEKELQRLKRAQKDASDADRERLVREILAEEDRRRKAEAQKAKLQMMGICPAGFHWIKQDDGYRCAGGAHWVPIEAMDKLA